MNKIIGVASELSNEARQASYIFTKGYIMPNWCQNTFVVHCKDKQAFDMLKKAFTEIKEGNDEPTPFSVIVPVPEMTDAQKANDHNGNIEIMHVNTYWGTKWEPQWQDVDCDEKTLCVSGSFDTAWSAPIPIYNKLVKDGNKVSAEFSEANCNFSGRYENGVVEEGLYGEFAGAIEDNEEDNED
jgi:hypothetical protein